MDIKTITIIIFTLSTIAIISMDLGLEYSDNEKMVYQHPLFQLLAILSGIYMNIDNLQNGIIVFTLWTILKFFKFKN